MALDHYVSQVHLKNFYAAELGERMYGTHKKNLKTFPCDALSQCRIEDGSTNPYLQEPRVIEDFLKDVEPRYNKAVQALRDDQIDQNVIYTIAGFAAYVDTCSPAAMRLASGPLRSTVETTAAVLEAKGLIPPAPNAFGGKTLTELLESGGIVVNIDPKYPQSLGIQTIEKRLSLWGNSRWDILLNTHSESPFFTSDYPVVIERSRDPRVLDRVIPLAPDLALRIYPDYEVRRSHDLGFSKLRYRRVQASRQDVMRLNAGIVQCAESTIYSSHNRPWVNSFIGRHRSFRVEPHTLKLPQGTGQHLFMTRMITPFVHD